MPVSDSAVFKFNFMVNDDDDGSDSEHDEIMEKSMKDVNCSFTPTIEKNDEQLNENTELEPFKIIAYRDVKRLDLTSLLKQQSFVHTWKNLKFINVTSIISDHVSQQLNTDLVKYKYEGGFKLWECSEDLVDYMMNDLKFVEDNVKNKNVCELGCGHSLPAIHCLLNGGANLCAFQDYNHDVIENLTIPNIIVNTTNTTTDSNGNNERLIESVLEKCEFYSGDWGYMSEQHLQKFDLILMSDTIYHVDSYDRLYRAIRSSLKRGGKVLCGAKSYYFGCGGSTKQFREFVQQREGPNNVKIETVKDIMDGTSNVREILLFTFY